MRTHTLSPLTIHRRLQKIFKITKKIGAAQHKWFRESPAAYTGTITLDSKVRKITYNINKRDGSYHSDYPDSSRSAHILAARDSELPLLINTYTKDHWPQEYKLLKGRLEGSIKEIPIRQDLVDKKEIIDEYMSRVYEIRHLLLEHLKRYIPYNDKNRYARYFEVSIEGTKYLFTRERDYIMTDEIERIKL